MLSAIEAPKYILIDYPSSAVYKLKFDISSSLCFFYIQECCLILVGPLDNLIKLMRKLGIVYYDHYATGKFYSF